MSDQNNPVTVLTMAQELYDKYVNEGREEGDRLREEGRAEAERVVAEATSLSESTLSDAYSEATRVREEADEEAAEVLTIASQRKRELEEKLQVEENRLREEIARLKSVEASYREGLREHLEQTLSSLDRGDNPAFGAPLAGDLPSDDFSGEVQTVETHEVLEQEETSAEFTPELVDDQPEAQASEQSGVEESSFHYDPEAMADLDSGSGGDFDQTLVRGDEEDVEEANAIINGYTAEHEEQN